jgi:uncharacterized phage-associated protein
MVLAMPVAFSFDFEKALGAIVYLASRPAEVPELDKYKLAKLLFLAEKYHLVRYGRPIFGAFYKALDYGPVPQQVLDLLHELIRARDREPRGSYAQRLAEALSVDRRFEHARFSSRMEFDPDALSQSEVDALERVIRLHGQKTFSELMALTHSMVAYRRVWESRRAQQKAVLMRYEDFFDEDADAVAGAREAMLENYELRKRLSAR